MSAGALHLDAVHHAIKYDQRPGQALFNILPAPVGRVVAGSLFDPFYTIERWFEVDQWIDNHLMFDDDGVIIAVFDNDQILWEATS